MFNGVPGTRRTFVVEIHADGLATVENLLTRERAAVPVLSNLGRQIEAWLAGPQSATAEAPASRGTKGDQG